MALWHMMQVLDTSILPFRCGICLILDDPELIYVYPCACDKGKEPE